MAENTDKTSQVVIDASVILAKLLPDEKKLQPLNKYFQLFAANKLDFVAPKLIKYEVSNGLRSAVKQNRLTSTLACKLLEQFLSLPIIYAKVEYNNLLKLAIKQNISVYDTAYLYLSKTKKLPLLTLDKKLQKSPPLTKS